MAGIGFLRSAVSRGAAADEASEAQARVAEGLSRGPRLSAARWGDTNQSREAALKRLEGIRDGRITRRALLSGPVAAAAAVLVGAPAFAQ